MDRRVLFLGEPAPVLCEGESLLSTSVTSSVARYPRKAATDGFDSSRRVELDLRHLRRVLDDLSRFCRDQEQLTCITARKISAGFSGGRSVSRAAPGRSNNKSSSNNNDDDDNSSNNSGRGSSSSSTRVLLAAVFPCPPPPAGRQIDSDVEISGTTTSVGAVNDNDTETIKGGGQQQQHADHEPQPQLTLLASAFAEVLYGCGVWLTPQEFQARVLVPTRALVDLQLGALRSSSARNDDNGDDDLAGSAAAAAAATTASVRAHPTRTTGNVKGDCVGDVVGDGDDRSTPRSKRRRSTPTPPPAVKSPKTSPALMSPSAATMSARLGGLVGMEAGGGDGAGGGAQASTSPLSPGVPLSEDQRGTATLAAASSGVNSAGEGLLSTSPLPDVPLSEDQRGTTTLAASASGDVSSTGKGVLASPLNATIAAPTLLPLADSSPSLVSSSSLLLPSTAQLGCLLSAVDPEMTSVTTAVNDRTDCRAVDEDHGATAAAVVEEEFTRGAVEEIEGLLRVATGGDGEMAGGSSRSVAVGGAEGVQSEGGVLPRRVLFDVIWAAASLPVGGEKLSA